MQRSSLRESKMNGVLIRPAVLSEQKTLEALQLRASLSNPGDRDALLANPDAIELPLEHIALGRVFVARGTAPSPAFPRCCLGLMGILNWTPCSSSQPSADVALDVRW